VSQPLEAILKELETRGLAVRLGWNGRSFSIEIEGTAGEILFRLIAPSVAELSAAMEDSRRDGAVSELLA
jgi:hypothetical protein